MRIKAYSDFNMRIQTKKSHRTSLIRSRFVTIIITQFGGLKLSRWIWFLPRFMNISSTWPFGSQFSVLSSNHLGQIRIHNIDCTVGSRKALNEYMYDMPGNCCLSWSGHNISPKIRWGWDTPNDLLNLYCGGIKYFPEHRLPPNVRIRACCGIG